MAETRHWLRVMSFNLQVDWENPPNTWSERREAAMELLHREAPHLIGTQEGLYGQLQDIEAGLGTDYGWIGKGREGGTRGEFMAVFYDRRRLEPLAYDHFWLSDTPDTVASNTWAGGCPRMVTWVRFRDLTGNGELFAANTHFDHASDCAREQSAALLAERLNTLAPDVPRIVTGDFNTPARHSIAHATLLTEAGLVDTWDAAEDRGPAYGTFHNYLPPVPDGERIDWILASRGTPVRSAKINTYAPGGRFPSDHLPVQSLVHTGL